MYFTRIEKKLIPMKRAGKYVNEISKSAKQRCSPPKNDENLCIKKAIHIGGDFEDIVTKSSIFVDKTLFVKEIIEDSSEVILITMPRRWGKSLNLDTLKRFLSIEKQNEEQKTLNEKLFKGGQIKVQQGFFIKTKEIPESQLLKKNPEAINMQGQYPVIFMDFKDCKAENFKVVERKLRDKIIETIKGFSYLSQDDKSYKNSTVGESYNGLLKTVANNDFSTGVKELTGLLHAHHNKKTWVLIDEYDSAVNEAYLEFNNKNAKQAAKLFRSVFEATLKGNEHLHKSVLTGVQYIVKSGMLSGLNNLSKYNIKSVKYSKYYGINQEEMSVLTEHFDIDDTKADRIKDWYNGYQLNSGTAEEPNYVDKYNIWSIVNYLNNQQEGFKPYWEKSGAVSEFLNKLLRNQNLKATFEELVNGKNIFIGEPKEDFDEEDFKQLKDMRDGMNNMDLQESGLKLFYSYLFITGYLTQGGKSGELKFPNKEIQKEMSNYLKDYYNTIFNIPAASFGKITKVLNKIFIEDDDQKISNLFQGEFGPQLSSIIKNLKIYDNKSVVLTAKGVFGNEDLMHSLLNNIAIQVVNAKFATVRHTTKVDGNRGRADIVLEKDNKGIIIEMKYNAKDAHDALSQAKDYDALVKNMGTKIFIGCNITDQQEVFLSGDIVVNDNDTIHFDYR
eukprot:snap_masked-scaffold_94-processed-gene-0.4-mRNA-1 protein AED:1.00 eAED:1.00 QI:0/-1/0/0/-1/1/1/0/670